MNLYLKKYKRYFDLFLTPFILILFSPILILTFLLLRISSTEKVIYKQLRIGLNGNLFPCYKFRTMHNTNTVNEHITSTDSTTIKRGILNKQKDDKRITKIGSFLRQSSLDELPQLFNVLRGEMSLVG
ncbi:MAG: sugar transferase, partial [Ignavibacteriaceae bacterium]